MVILLKFLMYLAGNRSYSVDELSQRFNISTRSVYRYLENIEKSGFVIERKNGRYKLFEDKNTQTKLKRLIHFSEEEVFILFRAASNIEGSTPILSQLLKKLNVLYDFKALQQSNYQDEIGKVRIISNSIESQKRLKFIQYRSSNSGDISDREVESFEFFDNYLSVWCLDCEDKTVKQFKLSRIARIEPMDKPWFHQSKHRVPYSDPFRMSAQEAIATVEMDMNLKAYNLLLEEFPLALPFVTKKGEKYRIEVQVADYHGIGRFVMGLPEDIIILSPQGFKDFIKEKIKILTDKI